jgi:hypothetical protein
MERLINCQVCGKPVIAYSSRTMYCDDCGPAARRAKRSEYTRRSREKKAMEGLLGPKPEPVHYCDSPERVALCLSCTKKKCVGTCETLRNMKVR